MGNAGAPPLASGPAPLVEQLQQLLAAVGLFPTDEALAFFRDFLAALAESPLELSLDEERAPGVVAERLAPRLALPRDLLQRVLARLFSPAFRASESPAELAAFDARFGPELARHLGLSPQRGLDAFAARHGSEDALLLLDTLLALARGPRGFDDTALAGLERAADELGIDDRYFGLLLWKHDGRGRGELDFPLEGRELRIGRAPSCEIRLLDPQVAPLHARLLRGPEGWRVLDAGSGRPTVVEQNAVRMSPLRPGQRLGIGPYTLWLSPDGERLLGTAREDFFSLSVEELRRSIRRRGRPDLPLLSGVSFTAHSGELIALVGPSGCGKTTLLHALAGIAPADSGSVRLDRADFQQLLEHDRSLVGFVPQDDLLHPELTVEEALTFAARLRFPRDVRRDEIAGAVDRVIAKLGLESIRGHRIGDVNRRGISGGQRKRVNLGQELLTSSTRLLFLDEPTSGLDPRASRDIVRLLRRLADEGRIVFLVTHDLTPAVVAQVDHLLVLAPGGHLAFFGPPQEAASFFGVSSPDAIFDRLHERSPGDWARAYRESPTWRKYVSTRAFLVRRAPTPEPGASEDGTAAPRPARRPLLGDLWTQLQRYALSRLRDRMGTLVLLAQPLMLALVMLTAFPEPNPPAIFMLTLASLWFGMSASVRELIADRPIWRRERRVGVRLLPYLGAKVLFLGTVVSLQCALLAAMIFQPLHLPAEGFSLPLLAGVEALTGLVGASLGLLVSAAFSSSEAAVGTLPLLLVPQITWSSIMVSLREMHRLGRLASWLNPFRYSFEAALKAGKSLQSYHVGVGWERMALNGHLYLFGFKGPAVDDHGLPLSTLALALSGFAAAFLAVTALLVHLRDR